MGSLIDHFKGDHRKTSDLVITIDGPSGSGKGTLAEFLSERMDIMYFSAGDFFRQIAEERDMTVEELSEKADREVDIEVDRRTLEKGLSEDCVIESRIASKVLGDYSDFSIYLTADLDERAERVMEDLGNRSNEEGGKSKKEVKERIENRDRDNNSRYNEYYGIDMWESDVHDIVMDNTDLTVDEQNSKIEEILKEKFPERFE